MKDIVIVGAGGCGREVYEMALETFAEDQYRIKGFLSDDFQVLDGFPLPIGILGKISDYQPVPEEIFLLAIGDVSGRKKVAEMLKARGAVFLSLIHPLAKVFPSAMLGEGVIIYPFVFISSHVKVGNFCLLNAYAGCGHDAKLGDFSVLCPHAAVLGGAQTETSVFLATHTTVAPKKIVGERATVSANTSVLRNVPADAFTCGVPGKNF